MSSLFQHFTFCFRQLSNLFHDLPLVLVKFKPMSIFYPCFASNCSTYFRMFYWCSIVVPHISAVCRGVHRFFSISSLAFINFSSRSLSHQLSSLCHCFYHFHPFSFCSSRVILLALFLHGFSCDICFINFDHL